MSPMRTRSRGRVYWADHRFVAPGLYVWAFKRNIRILPCPRFPRSTAVRRRLLHNLASLVCAIGIALSLSALLIPGPQVWLTIVGAVLFGVAFLYQWVTEWRAAKRAETEAR